MQLSIITKEDILIILWTQHTYLISLPSDKPGPFLPPPLFIDIQLIMKHGLQTTFWYEEHEGVLGAVKLDINPQLVGEYYIIF